jgi:hypothetical protein
MTHAATSLLSPPTFENTTTPASTPVRSLWLEVRRGRTRTPRRPIRSRRFLIGAGSNCQLQLGGDGIPLLHSILLVDEDGIHIDAVVPAPELVVNGVPQQSAPLRDGDSFRVGQFEFALRVEEAAGQSPLPVPGQSDESAAAEADDLLNLSSLSAVELVERIEREHHRLEQFEAARRAGARALLQAARQAGGDTVDAGRLSDDPLGAELLGDLHELSRELDRRARQLAEREAVYSARAADLLNVQDELVRQMRTVSDHLVTEPAEAHPRRALAS